MPPRTCPDCEFATDEATHETTSEANGLRVDAGGRERLHGRYGTEVQAYVYPGCGLVRLYAE
ncbi:hypothetical protein C474_00335 [Halogeometricum pallidum JCM 14848]|uniref:Uncharacterized protein n=1 Tax=Halogeometricum pallidum JCM 14848 TaxID=1227487 RepID=M0DJU6_HALPD|nr:hypothetical protein [Halogeometricum pallidum]ELZ35073.1 hypothetical protein C474_00335 [Halogeometricum pallidum JCM 14848]